MKTDPRRTTSRRFPGEAGQAIVFVVLALGLFLLGTVAFAVDMGWLWFHRQTAQTAADAACAAGAMDLLLDAQGEATGTQGFTVGTTFFCSSSPTASPCQYAALNGYDGKNTFPGNDIRVTFPNPSTSPPPGVTPPPSAIAGAFPFMRVDLTDHAQTFFFGLLSGRGTVDVRAGAVCGVVYAQAPIPILVLDTQNPTTTPPGQSALDVQGTPTIAIVGGPSQSIQVNSGATAATNSPWGTATIDLSKGGPQGTGSDIGLHGGPTTAPTGFIPGTTGHWNSPSSPMGDPFALVCFPGQAANCTTPINGNAVPAVPTLGPQPPGSTDQPVAGCASIPCNVPYHVHGCPDTAGCKLYTHGLYNTGIQVGPGGGVTAIFDPGLYYVVGGLSLNSLSIVRPGTGTGDGSGGVTFYFSGTGTVSVAADSGSRTANMDVFNTVTGPVTSGTTSSFANGVGCTAASTIPTNLQGGGAGINLQGNILLGACSGYYGDPQGTADPIGEQHGFLFFQDRSAQSVNPNWGGGGQFLLAGDMYFHSCKADGSGVSCGAAGTWLNDVFGLGGTSGSSTYVLGDIVTDNLLLRGTSGITMDLNPTTAFSLLKATLLQ
jgi:hypothetical protein